MAMKRVLNNLGVVVISLPIAQVFYDHVVDLGKTEGPCMRPLINPEEGDSDFILKNRWSVRNYQIRRGDIVSLNSPIEPLTTLGKRVIALERDTIRTLGYKEPYVTVPRGHCWVEGDNREQSEDSNYFGPVPVGLIRAKTTHVVWPPRHWQRLGTAVPSDRAPLTEQDLLELEKEGTPKL